MNVHNKKSLEDFRRNLRANSTEAEQVLWQVLRNSKLGIKFKRQHSIGNYIVDFYCASQRIIIEADGGIHLRPDQIEKDQHRDENLRDMDFKILRFTNDQILDDIELVKAEILKHTRI
jgi:very-short-patch-repair endonuclease